MFDHIRHADRTILFLDTVLLMDVSFLPFAASVLAKSFRDGEGERVAVIAAFVAYYWLPISGELGFGRRAA